MSTYPMPISFAGPGSAAKNPPAWASAARLCAAVPQPATAARTFAVHVVPDALASSPVRLFGLKGGSSSLLLGSMCERNALRLARKIAR